MAYVLELSNPKTNQHDGEEDDDDDNRSSNDSDNIKSNQKYVNVSSRDNRNFYNNNNQNIGDDADKMNNALNRGPFFDVSASKNVTALVSKTANLSNSYLHCFLLLFFKIFLAHLLTLALSLSLSLSLCYSE